MLTPAISSHVKDHLCLPLYLARADEITHYVLKALNIGRLVRGQTKNRDILKYVRKVCNNKYESYIISRIVDVVASDSEVRVKYYSFWIANH